MNRLSKRFLGAKVELPKDIRELYKDLPIDLHPKIPHQDHFDIKGKRTLVAESPDQYFMRRILEDVDILVSVETIERGLTSRSIAITSTPTLITRADHLRGYIFLNPATSVGLTSTGTILASAARTVDGNTQSASLGVANFKNMHLFINVSAVAVPGIGMDIFVQALDPVSNTWFDTQQIEAAIIATQDTYHSIGDFGIGTDFAIRWTIPGGATFTFSVGYVLKDGVGGTASGLLRTIYMGGTGVSVASGFPLLEGQREKFYLRSNAEIWGIAESALTLKLFELG